MATTSWLPDTPAKRRVWAIRCAIVLGVLVLIASAVDKTLWSWLDLLIIPVVLAIGGYWFNRQQQSREFAIADQRSQDEALQAYLDHMAQLLTDKEPPLRSARPGDDLSVVAWAWTKTVLRMMGPERKGHVLRFVNEAGLINKDCRVFSLSGADLREADLRGSVLRGVSRGDDPLPGVNLSEANLRNANLKGTQLREANLSKADLVGAILRGSVLIGANLSSAKLEHADLSTALLREANLSKAGLAGANLRNAKLSGANFSGANLRGAKGITIEKLDKPSVTLEGATMPDGQKYEDWLKNRGEDGENSASS